MDFCKRFVSGYLIPSCRWYVLGFWLVLTRILERRIDWQPSKKTLIEKGFQGCFTIDFQLISTQALEMDEKQRVTPMSETPNIDPISQECSANHKPDLLTRTKVRENQTTWNPYVGDGRGPRKTRCFDVSFDITNRQHLIKKGMGVAGAVAVDVVACPISQNKRSILPQSKSRWSALQNLQLFRVTVYCNV